MAMAKLEEGIKIRIPIGDWSDDGHGKCDHYYINSNYDVHDLQEAYKASCKLTGFQFNHNEDYTGLGGDYDARRARSIATEYEDYNFPGDALEKFLEFNPPSHLYMKESFEDGSGYFESSEYFVDVLLWFISLSMPKDWEYRLINDDHIPTLNGYWNGNLNVQFGYGLFN